MLSVGERITAIISIVLMSAPFMWSVIYLFVDDDPSSRAERLLATWPFLLIMSLAIGLFRVRRRTGLNLMLPFILAGTILGAFLSQQLWGSTYAIWPLLMILIAILIAELSPLTDKVSWLAPALASVNRNFVAGVGRVLCSEPGTIGLCECVGRSDCPFDASCARGTFHAWPVDSAI